MPTKLPLTENEIRSIARSHSRSMISVLLSVARQKTAPHASRIAAANSVLDRGWGKPKESVEVDNNIQVTIRHIIEGVDSPRCIDADITQQADTLIDASPVLPNKGDK